MSNRHQELTSPEQTATGKDFSNPLIVDSLLKTIWSSMHHVFTMKHWLVQSKRLLLDDQDGVTSIPNSEIFAQLALMGYDTELDNPKKTAWEQFSSNITTAVIYMRGNSTSTTLKNFCTSLLATKFYNKKRPQRVFRQEVALFRLLAVPETSSFSFKNLHLHLQLLNLQLLPTH
ncbi:hypothetical protein Tco_0560738 [Tanacetum coccineum]